MNTDITITVQASETLTGAWTDLASSVKGGVMTALVAGVTVTETSDGDIRHVEVRDANDITDPAHPQRFMRVMVTGPP